MAHAEVLATTRFLFPAALLVCLFVFFPAFTGAQPSGTVSEAQLEQRLQSFPDFSKFVQILQTGNFTRILGPGGSLYNTTIFAFNNAADVPRWAFNFTLVQCALSEPDHADSNTILSYNIIKGKYTFAQLQRLTTGNAFFGGQLFVPSYGRIIDGSLVGSIVAPDLVDDPTLSVHGVSSIDYFKLPGAPDSVGLTCSVQAAKSRGDQGACGLGPATAFPLRCYFNSDPQGRYVCCDEAGCDGFNPPDNLFPHCAKNGYVPAGYGVSSPVAPPPSSTPPPPSGDQGVCGSGAAASFPTRCYFNSDPQGRYVCCDQSGCNGFNPPDYSFPHCANNGFVPPGYGVSTGTPGPSPGPPASSGDQGVCGTGAASPFPVRCWYNNDPRGRYVCCDNQGCDGFIPPDYLFPHCKSNGYVPPGI